MKKKFLLTVILTMCIFTTVLLVGCNQTPANKASEKVTRDEFSKKEVTLEKEYLKKKDDEQTALDYANALFILGKFDKVDDVLSSFIESKNTQADTLFLSARIDYVKGDYENAINKYKQVIKKSKDEEKVNAELGLLLCYYQTNQYSKANTLFEGFEKDIDFPIFHMMRKFGDKPVNQVDFGNLEKVEIPFLAKDSVPIVPITLNGKKINAAIDNGGDALIISPEIFKELELPSLAEVEGEFAGGKKAKNYFSKADELLLDEVKLSNIPVMTADVASTFAHDTYPVDAIIGTNVLKQFLSTVDFLDNKLVLRPKDNTGSSLFEEEKRDQQLFVEKTMVLTGTHYSIIQGEISSKDGISKDGLNFFVDSGLDDPEKKAMLAFPKETLDLLNISEPKMEKLPQNVLGGAGGNDYKIGRFSLDKFAINDLVINDAGAVFGTFDSALYYDDYFGFIFDGMIGDGLLNQYRWTMDYENMKMYLTK